MVTLGPLVGNLGHTTEPDTGGLVYMRARWMDPVTGRFLSEDPARDGANWFGYCGGDPVNAVDRDGREDWAVAGGLTAVVSTAFALLAGLCSTSLCTYLLFMAAATAYAMTATFCFMRALGVDNSKATIACFGPAGKALEAMIEQTLIMTTAMTKIPGSGKFAIYVTSYALALLGAVGASSILD